jgi:hypothetical protein
LGEHCGDEMSAAARAPLSVRFLAPEIGYTYNFYAIKEVWGTKEPQWSSERAMQRN